MSNTRYSTALHILTLLALHPDEWLSSDYVASSICINPVVVRREVSVLNEAGFVQTRKGKDGGSKLNKNPEDILLGELYKTVRNTEILGKKHQNTNVNCPVGKNINAKLEKLTREADALVIQQLNQTTLAALALEFA